MKDLICPKCGSREFLIPHPASNKPWTVDNRTIYLCRCGEVVTVIPHPPKYRGVQINDTDEVK